MPNCNNNIGIIDELTDEYFQKRWATYQKVIDNNYIFHREVYTIVSDIISTKLDRSCTISLI